MDENLSKVSCFLMASPGEFWNCPIKITTASSVSCTEITVHSTYELMVLYDTCCTWWKKKTRTRSRFSPCWGIMCKSCCPIYVWFVSQQYLCHKYGIFFLSQMYRSLSASWSCSIVPGHKNLNKDNRAITESDKHAICRGWRSLYIRFQINCKEKYRQN